MSIMSLTALLGTFTTVLALGTGHEVAGCIVFGLTMYQAVITEGGV